MTMAPLSRRSGYTHFAISLYLIIFLCGSSVSAFSPYLRARQSSKLFLASDSSTTSSTPIVGLNVILRIKPEVREKFLEVILNNQRGTMDKKLEPLAIEYTFGEDTENPNTFHFHEKYRGEEGIKAHNEAPHFKVWEEFASSDPFSAPPEVYKFVIHE